MLHLLPAMEASGWLDSNDLVARLRISKATVARWSRSGKLPPSVRIGAVVRWRAEDVQAWADALRSRAKRLD